MRDFLAGVITGAVLLFMVFMVPFTSPNKVWQQQTIERGYGLYCPDTGDFAFVGECDNG